MEVGVLVHTVDTTVGFDVYADLDFEIVAVQAVDALVVLIVEVVVVADSVDCVAVLVA